MKKINMWLESIENLAHNMMDSNMSDYEREVIFETIKDLADKLYKTNKKYNNDNAYVSEKIDELIWSCKAIAHLSDGNGHSESQHMSWVYRAIRSIQSPIALGPIINN